MGLSISAEHICDAMLGYDNVIDAIPHNGNDVEITTMDNQGVVDALCEILEPSHDWQVYLFDEDCDGEQIAQWIRQDPEDTVIIVDNRLGSGPHMEWLYEPGVLGAPARKMVIVVDNVDGYWTAE